MIGVIFASSAEAAPFVAQYADGRFDELEEGTPIQAGEVLVAVTGPGKIKATLATERLLETYDLDVLLHAGEATTLTDEIEGGDLLGITFVLEGDHVDLEAPSYPRMPLENPLDSTTEGTLVTRDHTPTDSDEKSYWERIADIRDTTGYAIAFVAAQHGTPCHIAKVVTAQTQETGAEREAYQALADALQNWIEAREEETDQ